MGNLNQRACHHRRELVCLLIFTFASISFRIWILAIDAHNINLGVFAAVVTVVTIILILRCTWRQVQQNRENLLDADQLVLDRTPIVSSNLTQEMIDILPQSIFKARTGQNPDKSNPNCINSSSIDIDFDLESGNQMPHYYTVCTICLCDYVDGDELLHLPKCHHTYHRACVSTWLLRKSQCPLCKQEVVTTEINVVTPAGRTNVDNAFFLRNNIVYGGHEEMSVETEQVSTQQIVESTLTIQDDITYNAIQLEQCGAGSEQR
jgi:hypothetical protein